MPNTLIALTEGLKLDVRAHQRTYDGAYTRTAVQCLTFAMLIIKLFSTEFIFVGIVYTAYACFIYFVGVYNAKRVDFYYKPGNAVFKTAGNTVWALLIVSFICYLMLLALILKM